MSSAAPSVAERGSVVTQQPLQRQPFAGCWDWQLQAACRGLDSTVFFHPEVELNGAKTARVTAAKEICQRCPAIESCRAYALSTREPYGVWGGLSEEERADILGLRSLRYPATK